MDGPGPRLESILGHCERHALLHMAPKWFDHWTTWAGRQPGVSLHQKGKPFWILLQQQMMGCGWQWHQLDHMQIICISLQTSNHASTSPLSFYRPDVLPAAQPTVSKHWRHNSNYTLQNTNINKLSTLINNNKKYCSKLSHAHNKLFLYQFYYTYNMPFAKFGT